MKIKGNTVGTPIPRSNFNQTDPKKADYLVGRENIVGKDNLASVTEEILAQAKASGEFNGSDGKDGVNGKDGTSVAITGITESDEDGGENVVTFSDGKTLTVKNGNKGGDGEGGGGNSVYFSEEEPTDAKTGDFWYDESEGESEGGSASVQADWYQDDPSAPDYVKHRTHYIMQAGTKLVDGQTVTIGEELYCELDGIGDLVEGNVYSVVFNGYGYTLTAKRGENWDCVYLGNGNLVEEESEDTEPFAIDAYPDDGGSIYLNVFEEGTYTIRIICPNDVVRKLSSKYLPDKTIPSIGMLNTDTAATIEPNRLYVFPEMASLDITLGGDADISFVQEYRFRFTSGATATTLTLPADVVGEISVEANKVYEVSILDGYLVSQSWEVS